MRELLEYNKVNKSKHFVIFEEVHHMIDSKYSNKGVEAIVAISPE